MTRPGSLRLRLAAGSLALVLVSLVAVGALLVVLFRGHIERRFDDALHDHLEELAAAAERDDDGRLQLTWEPADPRFKPPLSGWYWEIRTAGEVVRRSQSLGTSKLDTTGPGVARPHHYVDIQGPADECLRVIAQDVTLAGRDEAVTIMVAGPRIDIRNDVRRFAGIMATSLAILALGLAALTAVQVGYGLRPLSSIRAEVNAVRQGRTARLDGAGAPSEVQPLIEEVNALLGQREAMLERARAEAGDLAHALKTPLAIMSNEAGRMSGEAGVMLRAEIARIRRVVEHHLVRARAAAGARAMGSRAAVDDVLADVRFAIGRLAPGRTLAVAGDTGTMFAGSADDLAEMIGNLADNATKWARARVEIAVAATDGRIVVTIDDDGPGLDEADREAALARGVRLETAKPGHGLGLSIVAELATHYQGSLTLDRAPLGGLRARLELPAAK